MTDPRLLRGDCRALLAALPAASVDAIVTDPPYELGFMGRAWDRSGVANDPETWAAALRVLKPGGYLLAFGGTRTYHRMACAVEDAGFVIRDSLAWLYGSGFPKSLDVGKALDKAAGVARGRSPDRRNGPQTNPATKGDKYRGGYANVPLDDAGPGSDLARRWDGWGTALKPGHEPLVLAQRPLEGTYAANLAQWGVGALNIAGCRLDGAGRASGGPQGTLPQPMDWGSASAPGRARPTGGRWPANVLLDEAAAAELDAQAGTLTSGTGAVRRKAGADYRQVAYGVDNRPVGEPCVTYGDSGGASRFFYVAKASRAERNAGLDGLPDRYAATMGGKIGQREHRPDEPRAWVANHHPTVKPVALLRWLVRLVAPPGGTVLDPFCGSGSTGVACVAEGRAFLGCDLDADYLAIAAARLAHAEGGR